MQSQRDSTRCVRDSGAAELLPEAAEAALIKHVIKRELFGKQAGGFRSEEQPFDVHVALRNIGRHNQETESIRSSLKSSVGLLAGNHTLTVAHERSVFRLIFGGSANTMPLFRGEQL